MSEGLEPLLEVLERARQPVDCFIRDDDGGWDNERQIALLCGHHQVVALPVSQKIGHQGLGQSHSLLADHLDLLP